MTPETAAREIAVFSSIPSFAERNELIERSPIPRGRIRPLPEEARTGYFTPEEWERFSSIFEDANTGSGTGRTCAVSVR